MVVLWEGSTNFVERKVTIGGSNGGDGYGVGPREGQSDAVLLCKGSKLGESLRYA